LAHDVFSKANLGTVRVALDDAALDGQVGGDPAAFGKHHERHQPALPGDDRELAAREFAHDE
jgi:hypothetical protein